MIRCSDVRLFSADLDGTLLGNPDSTWRFKLAWEALSPEAKPLLVYNSGRRVENIRRLIAGGTLPAGDYYLGGVGTEVFDVAAGRELDEIHGHLTPGWDVAQVRQITGRLQGIRPQKDEVQSDFKSSWHLDRASPGTLRALERDLARAGLLVKTVYSSERDLDVLPLHATKGGGLEWLCARLRVPLDQVLVTGDTGNDTTMFQLPGVRGILVNNALPELARAIRGCSAFFSHRPFADGVLEGLRHYGVLYTGYRH